MKIFMTIMITFILQIYSVSALAASIPRNALQYGGHYYYIYSDVCDSWDEAERYCESLGGHLAVINNHEENQVLYKYMIQRGFESAYFGLTSDGHPGIWRWVNGDPVNYEHWHVGEPNNVGGREHWGMFYWKFEYDWNDGDFGGVTDRGGSAFICEWDTPVGSSNVQTPQGSQNNGNNRNQDYQRGKNVPNNSSYSSTPNIKFLSNRGTTLRDGMAVFHGKLVNNSNRRIYFDYINVTLVLSELDGTKFATLGCLEPLRGSLDAGQSVNRDIVFRNPNIHPIHRTYRWHMEWQARWKWN